MNNKEKMTVPSTKRLIIASIAAIGLFLSLQFIINSSSEIVEERKVIESQGYHYVGQSTIGQKEYNEISSYVSDSKVEQALEVIEITGDGITIKYNLWTMEKFPALGTPELAKRSFPLGIGTMMSMVGILQIGSSIILWLVIVFPGFYGRGNKEEKE